MRKVLSYALTLVNFAGFLLVFVVTRDLYRTLFAVLYGVATSRDMSAFQVSAALRTFDMVGMLVMGLAAIVLIIVIQSVYEGARDGVQLGARFATVSGLQVGVDRYHPGAGVAAAGGSARHGPGRLHAGSPGGWRRRHRGWYTAAAAHPRVAILIHAIDITDHSSLSGVP